MLKLSSEVRDAWKQSAVAVDINVVEWMFGIRHDFVSRHKIESGSSKLNGYIGLTAGHFLFTPFSQEDHSNLRDARNRAYTNLDGLFGFQIGGEYSLSRGWAIGLEFNSRATMSDWVDDASSQERGISKINDSYFTGSVRLSYNIPTGLKLGSGKEHHYNYYRHLKKARKRHHY